ncbi:hypothetical protein [Hymenobacter sp. APR13]|uniref:hypothetical protein n=1 Tax=Hymenobacter sp. APR13 TaxID=1356852 RepID=UPI0012E0A280|nr:hypothetical protein [Hymenobacter sp. APR13]
MKMPAVCALFLFLAGAASAQTVPPPPGTPATPVLTDSVRKPTPPDASQQQGTMASPATTEPQPTKVKEKRKRTRLRTNPNFPD